MEHKKTKVWPTVELTVAPEATEAAEFALNELGALGTAYSLLKQPDTGMVSVTGYFDAPPALGTIRNKMHEALKIHGLTEEELFTVKSANVKDQDWLAEWKRFWKPTETRRFIIAPPWEDVETNDRELIRIEPNMAFGTGTHETTRLCLKAIEDRYVSGMSFFDVGTGTGILAIAAARLCAGGDAVLAACDTDPEAVAIAEENAASNGVPHIGFFVGTIADEPRRFDFVCANLTAAVILPILPALVDKANKILVLSGILVEQEEKITGKLAELGITGPLVKRDGEWISITVGRP